MGFKYELQAMKKNALYGTVIVTYRCNARCNMCDCWKDPTRPEDEISIETIRKLPRMEFVNITGGEPFVRKDLTKIIEELYKKNGSYRDFYKWVFYRAHYRYM